MPRDRFGSLHPTPKNTPKPESDDCTALREQHVHGSLAGARSRMWRHPKFRKNGPTKALQANASGQEHELDALGMTNKHKHQNQHYFGHAEVGEFLAASVWCFAASAQRIVVWRWLQGGGGGGGGRGRLQEMAYLSVGTPGIVWSLGASALRDALCAPHSGNQTWSPQPVVEVNCLKWRWKRGSQAGVAA